MKTQKIPIAAIERNNAWIQSVTDSLKINSEQAKDVMHQCGKQCASQLLDSTIRHFGRTPDSVLELVEAMNMRRRDVLNAETFWEKKDGHYRLILNRCSCDLVEAGLATPNPVFCECSRGMFKTMFSKFWKGEVDVLINKSIGRNDSVCEFIVLLNHE